MRCASQVRVRGSGVIRPRCCCLGSGHMYRTYWSLSGRFDVFALSLFIAVGRLLFPCLSPPLSPPPVRETILVNYTYQAQMSQCVVVWCKEKGVGSSPPLTLMADRSNKQPSTKLQTCLLRVPRDCSARGVTAAFNESQTK